MTSPEAVEVVAYPRFADDVEITEHCGVSGAVSPNNSLDVVDLVSRAEIALDHRGQDGAGITVWDGTATHAVKVEGRTKNILQSSSPLVTSLRGLGSIAVAHNRYGTDPTATGHDALQPYYRGSFSQAHNGQINNADTLAALFGVAADEQTSDSQVLAMAVANVAEKHFNGDIRRAYRHVLPSAEGAFSLIASSEEILIGIRDRHGIRPLVIGRLENGGTMLASETTGLTAAGATLLREVLPAQMVTITKDGAITSELWTRPEPAACLFEYVYFSKGTNTIGGKYVNDVRAEMGRRLAIQAPVEADVVIDIPASGEQFALAYAQETGIPYGVAFFKNYDVGRAFTATRSEQHATAKSKLQSIESSSAVAGKRVVVVDDSIVRGTSIGYPIKMLRDAGATEIHLRIPADQYVDICQYGVDTADKEALFAIINGGDTNAMCKALGVDSIAFLPLTEMLKAVETEEVCAGCMGGNYAGQEPIFSSGSLFQRIHERATSQLAKKYADLVTA